jgi:hypothetical protein
VPISGLGILKAIQGAAVWPLLLTHPFLPLRYAQLLPLVPEQVFRCVAARLRRYPLFGLPLALLTVQRRQPSAKPLRHPARKTLTAP